MIASHTSLFFSVLFRPFQTVTDLSVAPTLRSRKLTNQSRPRWCAAWNLWLGKKGSRFYSRRSSPCRSQAALFLSFSFSFIHTHTHTLAYSFLLELYLEPFLFCMQYFELFLVAFFHTNWRRKFAAASRHIFQFFCCLCQTGWSLEWVDRVKIVLIFQK